MLGLTLAALSLPLTAHSQDGQYGDWEANWTQVDQDGKAQPQYVDGWRFLGTLTGHASLTGNYPAMLSWWNRDPNNLPLAFSPPPNPPGVLLQSFLFGGPDVLDNIGMNVSASASNYWTLGYGRATQFGDEQNGIPTKDVTGGITAHVSNPLKLRLKWTPIYDGYDCWSEDGIDWYDYDGNPVDPPVAPPAPDNVNLLVTTFLGVGTGIANAPFISDPLTGQVGRSASVTVSESKFGSSLTASVSDADPTNASGHPPYIQKSHLLQVPVNGGYAVVETDATGDAQASAPAAVGGDITYSYASAWGEVMAWSVQDDRAVTISANVDPTNMKSPKHNPGGSVMYDENGDEVFEPKPHIPLPDGTMSGDVGLGYGYTPHPGFMTMDQTAPITYYGNPLGWWYKSSSQYNWFSSLKQSGASGTINSDSGTIDYFRNSYYEACKGPDGYQDPPAMDVGETGSSDHIHLTYTDGQDGASATANYYMTLHTPDEFRPSNKHSVLVPNLPPDVYYKDVDVEPASPGFTSYGGGVSCTWNDPGALWDYLGGGLDAISDVPGVDEVPWLGFFLTAAGIGAEHLHPKPDSGTANFEDAAWDDPSSTFPSGYPKGSAPKGLYHMTPRLHTIWKMHYTLKDHWGMDGYEGTTLISSSDYQGQGPWFGDFVYVPQPG